MTGLYIFIGASIVIFGLLLGAYLGRYLYDNSPMFRDWLDNWTNNHKQ